MTEATQQTENMKTIEKIKRNLATGKYETRFATFGMCLFIGLLFIAVGSIYSIFAEQQEKLAQYTIQQERLINYITERDKLEQDALKQEKIAQYAAQQEKLDKYAVQQEEMAKAIKDNRKIYVYSLEEVLVKIDALESRQQFEEDILKLNEELLEGEKKIKTIKEAKLRADFSDVYLKNLRMKRDELVEKYQSLIEELTQKINKALAEISKEKDVPVVFLRSSIAVSTPYVVDLTDEIAAKLQPKAKKK